MREPKRPAERSYRRVFGLRGQSLNSAGSIGNSRVYIPRRTYFFISPNRLSYQPKSENAANRDAISEATSETTVIWVFIEGPAVSLKGSPTVSPVTAAL